MREQTVYILWKGILYDSLENCYFTKTDIQNLVESTVTGNFKGEMFKLEYHLQTNSEWKTLSFEIKIWEGENFNQFKLQSDGEGHWTKDGNIAAEYNGCMDIDISLTPFTNTLPINRLRIANGEVKLIKVLYVDILQRKITTLLQKYTRLSKSRYKYENVPNDFEAELTVDDQGLVVDYPGLFRRIKMEKQ